MDTIDLRSDTVTLPDAAMRQAMAAAEVGDDVFGEDPTVRRLEELAAERLGKAAGLFVTSGTQGNLVALLTHCGRGDAAIVGRKAHINWYEGGGLAVLGGIMPYGVDDDDGIPTPETVREQCLHQDVHYAPRRLLCLENTHNRCGGIAIPPDAFRRTADAARENGLVVHLDGARLFNACVRLGVPAAVYADAADSVQICLSKGLGAPVGSVLCGTGEFVETARHWRKRVGGGLRQAGILAAAGIHALQHNIDRLAEDHDNARLLAELLGEEGVAVERSPGTTNMVFFSTSQAGISGTEAVTRCERQGVRVLAAGPARIRAVAHLGIDEPRIRTAAERIVRALAPDRP